MTYIYDIIFLNFPPFVPHSGRLRLAERWSSLQYKHRGSVASADGQDWKLWVVSVRWLHRGLLRQNLVVRPNLRQFEHWTGERTLGDTDTKTLKTDIHDVEESEIRIWVSLVWLVFPQYLDAWECGERKQRERQISRPSKKSDSDVEWSSRMTP